MLIDKIYYAGIGSRIIPSDIFSKMTKIAHTFEKLGFILRSGGSDGADTAFENGIIEDSNKEIFIPWEGFNGRMTGILLPDDEKYTKLVYETHPLKDKIKKVELMFHRRNCCQVLGLNLDSPVKFVLCWTPDGTENKTTIKTGGTGQAIRLANLYNIPVFNMKNENWEERLDMLISMFI